MKCKENPVGSELFHVDRRTDRSDEFNSSFSKFCERSQKGLWPYMVLERQRKKTKLLLWRSHTLQSSAERIQYPLSLWAARCPRGGLHVMAKTKFVSLPETERVPSFSSPYLSTTLTSTQSQYVSQA